MFYVLSGDYEKIIESPDYDQAIAVALARESERLKFRVVSLDDDVDVWSEDEPFTTHLIVWAGEQP